MVKYLSFDLWLTLIKSNPKYKQLRAEFLADCYNPKGLTCDEIVTNVRLVDKLCDRFNELNDGKVASEMMYAQVLLSLGNPIEMLSNELLADCKQNMHRLFEQHLPVFINEHIYDMLHRLNAEGYRLNLSSNTGYIEGDCLIGVLHRMDILNCFDFCIFSDQIRASKPSAVFYTHVLNKRPGIDKNQLLHVGDNAITDYKGALDFGFHALLINNSQYSIDDIRNAIAEAKP